MGPLMVVAGVAVIIGSIVFFAWLREKKRTEALQALAASLKFSFSVQDDGTLFKTLSPFHLFSQGHSRKVSNIMRGSANAIDVAILDYRYTTGGGKNSHTWIQTVILFQSRLLNLPAFALRPENVFHRIGKVFGYQDIDFDAHPAFSKQYLLRGSDEPAVRALFKDALLAHYEQSKGLSTEGNGTMFIFYRSSKRVPPEGIMPFMQEGFGVFGLVKARS